MRRTVSNILIIIFSAIIAVSGYRLWKIFREYHEGTQQYNTTSSTYVRHTDDAPEYLYTMINGAYNSSGSIFMDFRNQPDLSDYNTIIYGHHMKNGSMFASLHQYTKQSFYDEHKYLWFLTPDHIYRLDAIAGYVGNAEAEIYTIFTDMDELNRYLTFALSNSNFEAEKIPEYINGIIALSTCAYEYDDARYVLVCVPVMVD